MTAFKGLGTYGNAAGVVTPLDHKMAHTALVTKTTTANLIRAGLFYTGTSSIVTGHSNMSYNVAAYTCASQRSATAGVVFGGNDASYNVATTAAPGSNSRYDVIYHWHREYSIDGTDSNPVIGVEQGVAAASPTVPSLSAYPGAIELARVLVPAGVTATNSGTTFTHTAPFTSVDTGTVPFRTTTEMNVWTTARTDQRAIDLSSLIIYRWNGAAWKAWESDWITYTASLTNVAVGTGGSATNTARYRYEQGSVRVSVRLTLGTSGASVSGVPEISLPVTAAALAFVTELYPSFGSTLRDEGTNTYFAGVGAAIGSTTAARMLMIGTNGLTGNISSTSPFTWVAGDSLLFKFMYEPA